MARSRRTKRRRTAAPAAAAAAAASHANVNTIAELLYPDHAEDLEAFLQKFNLPYHGSGLPAAVGQVLELLLQPKREAFSEKKRLAQFNLQGGRCALCDGELRTGEDEGDHIQPLRDSCRGEEQAFLLLCLSCHQDTTDPG